MNSATTDGVRERCKEHGWRYCSLCNAHGVKPTCASCDGSGYIGGDDDRAPCMACADGVPDAGKTVDGGM